MDTASLKSTLGTRPLLVFLVLFGLMTALLVVGYAFFLRTDYTTLFTDLRAPDASAIVSELDKRGVKYKLENSGTAITVSRDQADETRIALAGSDLTERGIVGFELFNKSDMGLTNFAQKINYQRALQGELARTIMMMDGIETARIHLALPEKTLFSDSKDDPTAAVTIVTKTGAALDPTQVAGIQRLVAASVPDLPIGKVVILDESGRVVSADAAADLEQPADIEEHAAVEQYYRARAKAAVEAAMPGMGFVLRLVTLPLSRPEEAGVDADSKGAPVATVNSVAPTNSAEPGRNFALRVIFVSPVALNGDDQQVVRGAIEQAVGLNANRGDTLSFEIGPLEEATQPPPLAAVGTSAASTPWASAPGEIAPAGWRISSLLWLAAAILFLGVIGLRVLGNGRSRLSEIDRDAFAERLSRRIAIDLEGGDAAA